MRGRGKPQVEYKGNSALIGDIKTEETEIRSLDEVAQLLRTTTEDLAWLPFGASGAMIMSQARQLDDEVPYNRNAIMLAKKLMHSGLGLGVRGDVVIFREAPPWGPMPGDLRTMN